MHDNVFLLGGKCDNNTRESLLKTSIVPVVASVLGAFITPRATQLHLNTVSQISE